MWGERSFPELLPAAIGKPMKHRKSFFTKKSNIYLIMGTFVLTQ